MQKINTFYTRSILPNYQSKAPILKKITKLIHQHSNFLLTTHINSDMDGVGSQIGLYYLLKNLKKKCIIINNETAPLPLIPYIDPTIIHNINNNATTMDTWLSKIKDHFVFILDSSELKRSAKVATLFSKAGCKWASIDHHDIPQQKNYCVDDTYAATCEIIWDLFHFLNIKIPPKVAIPLYMGIVADSGNFRYNKTSFRTHLAGAELLSYKIDSDTLYRNIYEDHSIDRLELMKRIISNTIIDRTLGYIIGEVTPNMVQDLSLLPNDSEGLINLLLEPKEVRIAALLKKTDNNILKCSLRSKGELNVATLATQFGGGGHKNAAGLKIEKPYKLAKEALIAEVRKICTNP